MIPGRSMARRAPRKRRVAILSYTTWDPARVTGATGGTMVLTNGNLTATGSGTGDYYAAVRAALGSTTGKFYAEFQAGAQWFSGSACVGLSKATQALGALGSNGTGGAIMDRNGGVYVGGASGSAGSLQVTLGTLPANALIGMAVDFGNKRIWFRVNGGNWNASGTANPATNTGGVDITNVATEALYPHWQCRGAADALTANFGASAFTGAVPSGFTGFGSGPPQLVYYVDNAAPGGGDGKSWATAWNSFASVDWNTVNAGKTLYISGGTTSKTYNEALTVGASGTSGNPITIKRGIDPGHSGEPILDSQFSRASGVVVNTRTHVVIDGLASINAADCQFDIRNNTAGIVIQNCRAFCGDPNRASPNEGNGRGFDMRFNVTSGGAGTWAVILRDSSVGTVASTTAQTDGIWTSNNDGVLVERNTVVISNSDNTGHSDGWQSARDKNVTFRDNFISHPNGGADNHGAWTSNTQTGGALLVYNNVWTRGVRDTTGFSHWRANNEGTVGDWEGKVLFYNNTVYNASPAIQINSVAASECRNNIVHTGASGSATGFNLGGTDETGAANTPPTTSNFSHNLVYAPGGTRFNLGGYDTNGVNADPLFTNAATGDFSLQSGSPARNAGSDGANMGRTAGTVPPWVTPLESSKSAFVLDFQHDRAWSASTGVLMPIGSLVSVSRALSGYAASSTNEFVSFGTNAARRTDLGLLLENSSSNAATSPVDARTWPLWVGSGTLTDQGNTNGPFRRVLHTATENWYLAVLRSGLTNLNGVSCAVRVWFETGTSGRFRVTCRNQATTAESRVEGVVGSLNAAIAQEAGAITGIVERSLGNNMREVRFIFTSNSVSASDQHEFLVSPDGASGVSQTAVLLGAQIEVGKTTHSSLIATQATRPADAVSWGGAAATAAAAAATRLGRTAPGVSLAVSSTTATPTGAHAKRIAFFGAALTSGEQTTWLSGLSVEPMAIPADAYLTGINIAGADFGNGTANQGPGTGGEYIYPPNSGIDYYWGKGMRMFRIPFKWENTQRTLNGALDEVDMAHIDRVVNRIHNLGGWILIDPHNYCRRVEGGTGPTRAGGTEYIIDAAGSPVTRAHFADYWTKLANRYKSFPRVVFGLVNEPHDQDSAGLVLILNAAISAIRNAGAGNHIFVPGNHWTGAHSWTTTDNATNMLNIVDPLNNYSFEVHQYLDGNASGNHTDGTENCTVGSGNRMSLFTTWCRTNGKRAFLGEIGIPATAQCYTEFDTLMGHMAANKDVWVGWTYWAGGPWWSEAQHLQVEPAGLTEVALVPFDSTPDDKPQMARIVAHLAPV